MTNPEEEEEVDWLELEDEKGKPHRYLISELVELDERNYLALIPETSVETKLPPLVLVRYYLEEDQVEELEDALEYQKVFQALTKKYGEQALLG